MAASDLLQSRSDCGQYYVRGGLFYHYGLCNQLRVLHFDWSGDLAFARIALGRGWSEWSLSLWRCAPVPVVELRRFELLGGYRILSRQHWLTIASGVFFRSR